MGKQLNKDSSQPRSKQIPHVKIGSMALIPGSCFYYLEKAALSLMGEPSIKFTKKEIEEIRELEKFIKEKKPTNENTSKYLFDEKTEKVRRGYLPNRVTEYVVSTGIEITWLQVQKKFLKENGTEYGKRMCEEAVAASKGK